MRGTKTRISIARIGSNPSVRFINTQIGKKETKAVELLTIACSEVSDNKTTYVQKRVWNQQTKKFIYPPYVECDYVL